MLIFVSEKIGHYFWRRVYFLAYNVMSARNVHSDLNSKPEFISHQETPAREITTKQKRHGDTSSWREPLIS